MRYFERITEHNKSLIKPLNSDMIYYSELHTFFSPNAFRSLSVKYVIEQEILYRSEGSDFSVQAGQFMLACKHDDAKAYFDSPRMVRSICIDICQDTFREAYTVITSKDEAFDNYLAQYFRYPEFFENINRLQENVIDTKLKNLFHCVQRNETDSINKEWFLDLAEKIIYKEYGHYLALKDIHSAKPSTRKEIFRRLKLARAFMDEHFLTITEVKEIAKACLMSEYHFFRCFRQAFKITPYQYISEKKLKLAHDLLVTTETPVADIAFHCNYPDAFTFSKAFKRRFGLAPTVARRARSENNNRAR